MNLKTRKFVLNSNHIVLVTDPPKTYPKTQHPLSSLNCLFTSERCHIPNDFELVPSNMKFLKHVFMFDVFT